MKEKILELLAGNSRLTTEEIAAMLGVDQAEVAGIIEELESEKIIVKYMTIVNWEKFGREKVEALIEVKVTPQREVGFDKVAERIYRFPEVKSVSLMSGAYDLAVVIEGDSMKDVALFVAEKLAPLEHVLSTTTHFFLKRYKLEGVILDDQEVDRRLVISL